MASTFKAWAISGKYLETPLYCMIDVREITRSDVVRAISVMRLSVTPSTRYSCCGSAEKFSSGSTASDSTGRGKNRFQIRERASSVVRKAITNSATATTAKIQRGDL